MRSDRIEASTAPNTPAYTTEEAIEPLWSRHTMTSRATALACSWRSRPAAPAPRSAAAAGSGAGWRGWCGPSRCRPGAGPAGAARPVQRAGDRRTGPLRQPPLQVTGHRGTTARADSRACSGRTRLSDSRVPTRCTSGSTAVQHLGLEQQPGQAEPLDRVLLHHLHHADREERPDVAEPAGDLRGRCASPACRGPAGRARPLVGAGVVQSAERGVDPRVISAQLPSPVPSALPRASRQRRIRSS